MPSMTGDWPSLTVTEKEQEAIRPCASVVVNVWVVDPTEKEEPLARPAVLPVDTPGQLSVPTGAVYATVAAHVPRSVDRTILEGQGVEEKVPSI